MKRLHSLTVFPIFLLAFFLLEGQAKVIVVSDIDDTIKVSHVKNPTKMLWNHLTGPDSFPALINIYQDIKDHYESQGEKVVFLYLSASPKVVSVKSWLEKFGAPEGVVLQRSVSDLFFYNPEKFKIQGLKKFLLEQKKLSTEADRDLKIFLFGDNGQNDPQVYKTITEDPELDLHKVSANIRRVYAGAPDVDGVDYFSSEVDLLDLEPFSKVVRSETKKKIADSFLEGTLIPAFVERELGILRTRQEQAQCREESYGLY